MLVQGKQTNIWLHFVSYSICCFHLNLTSQWFIEQVRTRAFRSLYYCILVWWQCLASGQKAISRGIETRWHSAVCLGPEACSRQGQRSHNNSSAIVQPLFGLAELSKFRIWPQRNAEPTNLSRGIRKSPKHMRFMGSEQSLHISSHPETACVILSVFFPSVWVCYLCTYLFIISVPSFNHWFATSQVACYVCPWATSVMEVMEVWWTKQTGLPFAIS